MEVKLAVVSQQGKVASALRYALSRWAGLSRFLDDGHIEIDSNIVERAIRPLALNRKECVVRGLGRRWRALGDPRLAHRDLQTQWRRSASLSRRHLRPPRRRSPDQSRRRTASVELGRGSPSPKGRVTSLTEQRCFIALDEGAKRRPIASRRQTRGGPLGANGRAHARMLLPGAFGHRCCCGIASSPRNRIDGAMTH
jgi:hypothetical protein